MSYEPDWKFQTFDMPDYAERRRYALLNAAATVYAFGEAGSIKDAVLTASSLLAEIQNLESGEET